ncbi:MAG: hypothetical protein JO108_28050 [Acidobacteriaceae bacterium]|nr:hypothetical protein [Acidobacteriaceae bacterium]
MSIRRGLFVLASFIVLPLLASADVIQSTVILPPVGGVYDTAGSCVSTSCSVDSLIGGFALLSSQEVSGNQVEVVSAVYQSHVYTNNGGSPGNFLGVISLPGTLNVTYVGRDPSVNPLGSFATVLTSFDFSGIFNGSTVELKQNPNAATAGTTTINEIPGSNPVLYDVSGTILINGELSLNGGNFVPGPPVTGTLAAVPEPATGVSMLFLAALVPVAFAVRRILL